MGINGSRRDGRFIAPIPVGTHSVRPAPPATQSSSSEPSEEKVPQRNPFSPALLAQLKAPRKLRKTDFTEPTEEKQLSSREQFFQAIGKREQYFGNRDSPDSPNEDSNDNNNRVSFATTVPKVQSVPEEAEIVSVPEEAEKPKPKPDQRTLIKRDEPNRAVERMMKTAMEFAPSLKFEDSNSWSDSENI